MIDPPVRIRPTHAGIARQVFARLNRLPLEQPPIQTVDQRLAFLPCRRAGNDEMIIPRVLVLALMTLEIRSQIDPMQKIREFDQGRRSRQIANKDI